MNSPGINRAVGKLRRRLLMAGVMQGICWGLGTCGAVGLAAIGADRFVVVPRLAWPVLATAAGMVLLLTCIALVRRGRRPVQHLVHWIDVENRYEDIVASAWQFAGEGDGDPWKLRCVALAEALVSRHPPRMPRMRLGRVERPLLIVTSFAVVLGLNLVIKRRPKESDARAKVVLDGGEAAVQKEILRKATERAEKAADRQAEELARSMAAVVDKSAHGGATKEELLQDLSKLRSDLGDLGNPQAPNAGGASSAGELPAGSAVQAAALAVKQGDLGAAATALAQASAALAHGDLSTGEIEALSKLVGQLAKLADANGATISQLNTSSEAFVRGNLSAAASSLSNAVPKLGGLQPALKHEALYRELEKSLTQLEHEVRGAGAPGGGTGPDGPATGNNTGHRGNKPLMATPESAQLKGSTGGTAQYTGESGVGSSTAMAQRAGAKGSGVSGQDLAIVGEWSGKTMRELVAGATTGQGAPVAAQVVGAHQRVAEAALDRDDVPEEYRVAVRNYFEAIRLAGEHAWKSSNR